MYKLLLIAPLLFALSSDAQVSNPSIISVTSAPSGSCTPGLPNQQVVSTGIQYSCQSGTWAAFSASGATGTVTSVSVTTANGVSGTVATATTTPAITLTLGAIAPTSVTPSGPIGTAAEHSNGTCTTAATISPANGNHQSVTLTNADACALTFTQPSSGTITITLKIIQSSSGSFNGTISGGKWPGGSVPTITATSAAVDFITCYLDGTNAYCVASQNFQ